MLIQLNTLNVKSRASGSEYFCPHKRVSDIKDPSKHLFQVKENLICLGKIINISSPDSSCHVCTCDNSGKQHQMGRSPSPAKPVCSCLILAVSSSSCPFQLRAFLLISSWPHLLYVRNPLRCYLLPEVSLMTSISPTKSNTPTLGILALLVVQTFALVLLCN